MSAVSEWLPIETAPKDGTAIIAGAYGHRPVMVSWREQWRYPFTMRRLTYPPTHWMPIPPPPMSVESEAA